MQSLEEIQKAILTNVETMFVMLAFLGQRVRPMFHIVGSDGGVEFYGVTDGAPSDAYPFIRKRAAAIDARVVALIDEAQLQTINEGTGEREGEKKEILIVMLDTPVGRRAVTWKINRPEGKPPFLSDREETKKADSEFFGTVAKVH
jgi:hypothetical protein